MENKFTPYDPFEEFVRKTMQNQPSAPEAAGDALWEKIATQQRPLNTQWQRKFWLKQALWPSIAAVVLVGALGIWWKMGAKQSTAASTAQLTNVDPTATLAQGPSASITPSAAAISSPDEWNAASGQMTLAGIEARQPVPTWVPRNEVPLQRLVFRAEAGIRYTSVQSGNTVIIPPNALTHADGSPAHGAVSLYYRDYRTVPDLFASNIPMQYSDERGTFTFNTGGMFDIRVGQGQEMLQMAENQQFQVQFAPTHTLKDASLYYFEQAQNAWEYVSSEPFGGSAVTGKRGALPRAVTERQVVTDNARAAGACASARIRVEDGRSPITWLRQGIEGGLNLAKEAPRIPKWLADYATEGTPDAARLVAAPGEVYITQRKDGVTRFFPQDRANIHTELAAFKDCHFIRVGDSLSRAVSVDSNGLPKNTEAVLRRTKPWTSIYIDQIVGDRCRLLLLDATGEGSGVLAQLVQSNEVPQRKNFKASVVFEKYMELRAARAERWKKQVQEMTAFVRFAQMHQTPDELCMPTDEWLKYFIENRTAMHSRYTELANSRLMTDSVYAANAINDWMQTVTEQIAQRRQITDRAAKTLVGLTSTLALNSFGLYNCDQIFRLNQTPEYVEAVYRNATGERVWPTAVNIMDWERRIFLPMPDAKFLIKQADKRMDVVLRDNKGRVYHLPGNVYKETAWTKGKETAFTLTDVTDTALSPIDWQRILGL